MADRESSSDRLIIYGTPSSQPARSVYWTCLIKRLPFELRMYGDWSKLYEPEFLNLNPSGQVPTIVDGEFALYEMPAILVYLCEKHGWQDLLPGVVETRGRIHQYLHSHHSLARIATMALMAPHVTKAFSGEFWAGQAKASQGPIRGQMPIAGGDPADVLAQGRETLARVADLIERSYFRSGTPFLCDTPGATIADIACYGELAQLTWARLFDFRDFPKLTRWLEEMAKLPAHDAAHRYNFALGDIASEDNTWERYQSAIAACLEGLEGPGVTVQVIGARVPGSA